MAAFVTAFVLAALVSLAAAAGPVAVPGKSCVLGADGREHCTYVTELSLTGRLLDVDYSKDVPCEDEDYDCWCVMAVKYTNDVRAKTGLPPLKVGSESMLKNTMDYAKTLADMGQLVHQEFSTANADIGCSLFQGAENIAQTVAKGNIAKACIDDWENSPGHLANIQTDKNEFSSIGFNRAAVEFDGRERIYCVQTFASVAEFGGVSGSPDDAGCGAVTMSGDAAAPTSTNETTTVEETTTEETTTAGDTTTSTETAAEDDSATEDDGATEDDRTTEDRPTIDVEDSVSAPTAPTGTEEMPMVEMTKDDMSTDEMSEEMSQEMSQEDMSKREKSTKSEDRATDSVSGVIMSGDAMPEEDMSADEKSEEMSKEDMPEDRVSGEVMSGDAMPEEDMSADEKSEEVSKEDMPEDRVSGEVMSGEATPEGDMAMDDMPVGPMPMDSMPGVPSIGDRACRCLEVGSECWYDLALASKRACMFETDTLKQPYGCMESCCSWCKETAGKGAGCTEKKVAALCMLMA